MGKKTKSPSTKSPTNHKHEKKHQTNSLIKILRPKVYITDQSKFKNLVQELTGNGNSPASSPPPSLNNSAPSWPHHHAYQESSTDVSFDSSCFSTPLDGSPDLRPLDPFDVDFSTIDLESLLMGIDNISNGYDHNSCDGMDGMDGMVQQQVCVYDYDFSSLI